MALTADLRPFRSRPQASPEHDLVLCERLFALGPFLYDIAEVAAVGVLHNDVQAIVLHARQAGQCLY